MMVNIITMAPMIVVSVMMMMMMRMMVVIFSVLLNNVRSYAYLLKCGRERYLSGVQQSGKARTQN